ncbi:hypothetical protein CRUP_024875, partial [Coryphaenoides rupestris]
SVGTKLCVLVLDEEGYERAKAQGQDLMALVKSQEMEGCKSPGSVPCDQELPVWPWDFSFTPVEVHVVREVEASSRRQRVGLLEGELLLEVNGEPVEALAHEDVVERIKQSSPQVTLTTISARGSTSTARQQESPALVVMPRGCHGNDTTCSTSDPGDSEVRQLFDQLPPPLEGS